MTQLLVAVLVTDQQTGILRVQVTAFALYGVAMTLTLPQRLADYGRLRRRRRRRSYLLAST